MSFTHGHSDGAAEERDMIYAFDVILLWLRGRMSRYALAYALRERHVSVAARGGQYIVDRRLRRDLKD
jgi:hypothetical protein